MLHKYEMSMISILFNRKVIIAKLMFITGSL